MGTMENSTAKHGTKRDSVRILLAEKKGAARRALAASSIRGTEHAARGDPSGDPHGCGRDPWRSRGAFQLSLSLVQES